MENHRKPVGGDSFQWQSIFQCFVEGNLNSDGKTKLKGSMTKGTASQLSFSEAMEKEIFGGILNQGMIDISFDDAEMSDSFMKMREANNWNCLVLQNPTNEHIHTYWKNTGKRIDTKSTANATTACGLVVDIHGGFTYIRLREPSHDRFPPLFCPDGDIDEVPNELLPVNKAKSLWGMVEGDGRNQAIYSHINVLISQLHLTADECRHILRNTNNFVLAEPLDQKELDIVLRDEAFEKPLAMNNPQNKTSRQELFKEFLNSLGMTIRYNELLNIVEYENVPSIEDYQDITDTQNVMPIKLVCAFEKYSGKRITKKDMTDLILLEADTHSYNPLKDYLQCVTWDGVDRFPRVFGILGVTDTLQQSLIRKWFYQTAAMPFNSLKKPFQAEGVLVLQGAEGIGKTRFFQQLAFNPKWFSSLDKELNTNNKDILIQMLSIWIAEIGELDRTFKANKSDSKSFITNAKDEIRKPYRMEKVDTPRTTSFCGTTNKTIFLTNDSGSRRWWIIPIKQKIVMGDFTEETNLQQFWAQCYQAYTQDNACFRLTDDEQQQLDKRNRENTEPLPGEEELRNRFDFDAPAEQWSEKTVAEIKDFPPYHVGNYSTSQIGKALTAISQDEPAIQRKRTKKGSVWIVPPSVGVC